MATAYEEALAAGATHSEATEANRAAIAARQSGEDPTRAAQESVQASVEAREEAQSVADAAKASSVSVSQESAGQIATEYGISQSEASRLAALASVNPASPELSNLTPAQISSLQAAARGGSPWEVAPRSIEEGRSIPVKMVGGEVVTTRLASTPELQTQKSEQSQAAISLLQSKGYLSPDNTIKSAAFTDKSVQQALADVMTGKELTAARQQQSTLSALQSAGLISGSDITDLRAAEGVVGRKALLALGVDAVALSQATTSIDKYPRRGAGGEVVTKTWYGGMPTSAAVKPTVREEKGGTFGSALRSYLGQQFLGENRPTQTELQARYEQQQSRGFLGKLFGGGITGGGVVVYDPKRNLYLETVGGALPVVGGGGIAGIARGVVKAGSIGVKLGFATEAVSTAGLTTFGATQKTRGTWEQEKQQAYKDYLASPAFAVEKARVEASGQYEAVPPTYAEFSAAMGKAPLKYSENPLMAAYGRGGEFWQSSLDKLAGKGPSVLGWKPASLVSGFAGYLAPQGLITSAYPKAGAKAALIGVPHFGPTAIQPFVTDAPAWQKVVGVGASLIPYAAGPASRGLGVVGRAVSKVPVLGTVTRVGGGIVKAPFKAADWVTGGLAKPILTTLERGAPWQMAYRASGAVGALVPKSSGLFRFGAASGWWARGTIEPIPSSLAGKGDYVKVQGRNVSVADLIARGEDVSKYVVYRAPVDQPISRVWSEWGKAKVPTNLKEYLAESERLGYEKADTPQGMYQLEVRTGKWTLLSKKAAADVRLAAEQAAQGYSRYQGPSVFVGEPAGSFTWAQRASVSVPLTSAPISVPQAVVRGAVAGTMVATPWVAPAVISSTSLGTSLAPALAGVVSPVTPVQVAQDLAVLDKALERGVITQVQHDQVTSQLVSAQRRGVTSSQYQQVQRGVTTNVLTQVQQNQLQQMQQQQQVQSRQQQMQQQQIQLQQQQVQIQQAIANPFTQQFQQAFQQTVQTVPATIPTPAKPIIPPIIPPTIIPPIFKFPGAGYVGGLGGGGFVGRGGLPKGNIGEWVTKGYPVFGPSPFTGEVVGGRIGKKRIRYGSVPVKTNQLVRV